MLSESNTLPNASNNKTTISTNHPIITKVKLFFGKLFDNDNILGYEYSDNGICMFIDKSIYDSMNFEEKESLVQVKLITK